MRLLISPLLLYIRGPENIFEGNQICAVGRSWKNPALEQISSTQVSLQNYTSSQDTVLLLIFCLFYKRILGLHLRWSKKFKETNWSLQHAQDQTFDIKRFSVGENEVILGSEDIYYLERSCTLKWDFRLSDPPPSCAKFGTFRGGGCRNPSLTCALYPLLGGRAMA